MNNMGELHLGRLLAFVLLCGAAIGIGGYKLIACAAEHVDVRVK